MQFLYFRVFCLNLKTLLYQNILTILSGNSATDITVNCICVVRELESLTDVATVTKGGGA